METGERLSAYLAGELDADDAAALEAELAGDAAMRAQLERIRQANQVLASLPDVAPPADFSARLRDTLRDEIAQRGAEPQVDELAARRIQRNAGINRFVGIGVAAAAVAVVAGIGLSSLFGGADEDGGPTAAALEAADEADPLREYVRVTDTDYDQESVQALAEQADVLADVPASVGEDQAASLESERAGAFGLGFSGDATMSAPSAESGGGAQGGTAGSADGMGTSPEDDAAIDALQQQRASGTTDPFADVRRCLPEIVSSANEPVIPLFAEVARFQGEPAIVYLVLTREPGQRMFTRIEAWVVGRNDCFPRLFQQVKR